jgi:hypothetical protein
MSVNASKLFSAALLGGAAVCLLLLTGCSAVKSKVDNTVTHPMGNPVPVGSLTYTIVETDWRDTLDGAAGPILPQNRFLLINITVHNKGSREVGVPLLTLIDASGKEYRELNKGEGIPQWLGLLRTVQSSETESGRVAFDVPQGSYKVRVSSGGDVESESAALIDLPYVPDMVPSKPLDAAAPPAVPVK